MQPLPQQHHLQQLQHYNHEQQLQCVTEAASLRSPGNNSSFPIARVRHS